MRGAVILNRNRPSLDPRFYKTYGWHRPVVSHYRPATCEEADCDAWRYGWVTTVDITSDLGRRQYDYITHDKTRTYTVTQPAAGIFKFAYQPGHPCFDSGNHRVLLGRPPIFTVRSGDWRQFTSPATVHRYAEDWVDDFANHQDRLATAIRRG